MEFILAGIGFIIAVSALFILIVNYHHQKYRLLQVRIEEALKNIEYFLAKKEENLKKAIPLIQNSNKKKYGKKAILEDLIKNTNIKQSLKEQDESLRKNQKEFSLLLEEDEKLTKIKELNEIYFNSIEIENDLNASKKYYNKIVKKMDQEFKKFPAKLFKRILKYEKLEKFNTKKEETLEILKEENS